MKKWSEIQQATLNKMFLVLTDITDDVNDYLSKMIFYANEALSFIANDIRPNVREISLTYAGDFDFDAVHDKIAEKHKYYTVTSVGVFDGVSVEPGDYIYSTGADWIISKKNFVYEFPEDFISFADISNTFVPNKYSKGKDISAELNAEMVIVGRNKVVLPKLGNYKLYYYALYGEIPSNLAVSDADRDLTKDFYLDGELVFTGIPQSVLNTLPTYIASQLQGQDDPQRSSILRNEFEVMCGRLDDTNFYNIEGFTSKGGWI